MIPSARLPNETFTHFSYESSFEGVYLIKDWVLLGGAMVVVGRLGGATT